MKRRLAGLLQYSVYCLFSTPRRPFRDNKPAKLGAGAISSRSNAERGRDGLLGAGMMPWDIGDADSFVVHEVDEPVLSLSPSTVMALECSRVVNPVAKSELPSFFVDHGECAVEVIFEFSDWCECGIPPPKLFVFCLTPFDAPSSLSSDLPDGKLSAWVFRSEPSNLSPSMFKRTGAGSELPRGKNNIEESVHRFSLCSL